MKFLYIHGFNSAGYGDKVNHLREAFGSENVISINLPYDPEKAVELLEYLVRNLREEPLILVGTSLGGFYALYLSYKYGNRSVLINPAVDAHIILRSEIGHHKNYKTDEEYEFTEKHFRSLERFFVPLEKLENIRDRIYVYLDEGDEVLDSRKTAEYFKDFYVKLFPGGDHRFKHMPELIEDIKRIIKMEGKNG
ncbi:MAG TPA: esterase [Persephonella sp.]|uniref:Esterase n=1 Tax=Persephonella marina (strain DSM 14350 / EX-H1) TaxID=123214 RepID=C0QQK7_PERMH|nr:MULTISPECIES: YqiA/YcfP family alpha/beta fold hydrolase [Persephonella]ACO04003.1 esterase [Persephonella marina EX-H1]HCB69470.1 esterase [Persephonella sp.]